VGVTGHRDLRHADQRYLEGAVRAVLHDLRTRCPSTPLILLSPLAEGADRLVARVALDEGAQLIAPLPLPRELYEQDFEDESSLLEFRALLSRATRSFTLDLQEGSSLEDVRARGPKRNKQYEAVGAYLVRNCLFLIALWDGRESDAVGGTAQVLSFQRAGVPASYVEAEPDESPLDGADTGIVYQVVTPRVGKPDPVSKFTIKPLVPTRGWGAGRTEDQIKETFDRIIACIDGFNADAQRVTPVKQQLIVRSSSERLAGSAEQFEADFAIADQLAVHYRNRSNQVLLTLFGLAFLAVLCFSVYAHYTHREWPFLALNLSIVVVAYVVYIWAGTISAPFGWLRSILGSDRAWQLWRRRRDCKTRYLDYRALAEGMRVQFFWDVVGSRRLVADHYLRKQRGELDWIRAAIRGWTLLLTEREAATDHSAAASDDILQLVERDWVQDQRAYFSSRSRNNRRFAERGRSAVHTLVFIAVLASLGLTWVGSPLPPPGTPENLDEARELILVPLVLLSATAALIEGYIEKTAAAEQAKQYERMSLLYAAASDSLSRARRRNDLAGSVAVLEELGNEALAENGDWVMLHRARPMEVQFEG
jgi:hypothetical protein